MLAYLVAASLPRKQKGSLFPLPSLFVSSETFFPSPDATRNNTVSRSTKALIYVMSAEHTPFSSTHPAPPVKTIHYFLPDPFSLLQVFLGAPHTNENVAKRGEAVTTQFRPSSLFPSPDVGR